MKLILLFTTFILGFTAFTQQFNQNIMIGSESRDYIYYIPTVYNPTTDTVPVVFIFHGLGGSASDMVAAGFNQIADTANMIPVYMEGKLNAYGQTGWNNGTLLSPSFDDLAFVAQVLDSIQANFNIDSTKIFATGFSMGSIMSHHIACHNEEFSAIAAVAGPLSTDDLNNNPRTSPIRVMHMHGTADPTVPYDTGALPSLSLVPQTLAHWKNYNACSDSIGYAIENTVSSDNITVDWFVYNGCTPGTELEFWRLNGGAHIWPYPPVNDIFATTIVWHFLMQYDHGYQFGQLALHEFTSNENIEFYPNPTNDFVTITTDDLIQKTLLFSSNGTLIKENEYTSASSVKHDLSNLEPGIYYIYVSTNNGGKTLKIVKK